MKTFKQHLQEQEWKKAVAKNIRKMTPAQAKEHLALIHAEHKAQNPTGGASIFHATIRKLTGGYNSQSINWHVIRALHDKSKKVLKEAKTIPLGQCYPYAYRKQREHPHSILVHGHVTDPWTKQTYHHAWLEHGGKVHDWQTEATGRKPMSIAQHKKLFKPERTTRFTRDDALEHAAKNLHFGPWL